MDITALDTEHYTNGGSRRKGRRQRAIFGGKNAPT